MKPLFLAALLCCSQTSFALDVFKTGVPLSSNLGDMYCQNIVHDGTADWRMPALEDLLQLLSEGVVFEKTHCSNTTRQSTLTFYKCLTYAGVLTERLDSQAEELICIRGESEFSALPSLEECPTASFSMSQGILHIPLLNVPDLLGNIEKYDVHLKMTSDDLIFEFLRATKLE